MSRRIAAEEVEGVKRQRPDIGTGRGGRGKPRRSSWAGKGQTKEGVYELQGTQRESAAMAMQAEEDTRGEEERGVKAGEEKAAPTPPKPTQESGGEEDTIARYLFSIPAEEYRPGMSAFV